MKRALAIGAVVILLLATGACRRDEQGPAVAVTTTTTGALWAVDNDAAVMQVTNARCERELACNNTGIGREFVDRDACAREHGRNAQATLRAEVCPGGVGLGKLA